MLREYLTNKWVLSGICFLIVLSVACVLWYKHDTAADRQAATDAENQLSQLEATQTAASNTVTKDVTKAPAESTASTAEKQISNESSNKDTLLDDDNREKTFTVAGRVIRLSDIPDVPEVSPHGFGPFPEIPDDYNGMAVWLAIDYYDRTPEYQRAHELLDRVLIKLWESGERNFRGGKLDSNNGKVYPNFFNTVYITVKEHNISGVPYIARQYGRAPAGVDLLNPPSHINVLDYESSGIDPFQYLDLP